MLADETDYGMAYVYATEAHPEYEHQKLVEVALMALVAIGYDILEMGGYKLPIMEWSEQCQS